MCGIAGFLQKESKFKEDIVPVLWQALKHRGPDDRGYYALRNGDVNLSRNWSAADATSPVLLVHNRLSILDLSSGGWQPQVSADGRYAIVFNGEIYNYIELRAELEKLGCAFVSASDTEVLLQAYITWGSACLTRLVGMFAFAVFDRQNSSLFLARDFFGIKPLYFSSDPSCFGFCSTIQGLLKGLAIRPVADKERSFDYLKFGLTDNQTSTLFSGINQLPAAHFLQVSLDRPQNYSMQRYWNLNLSETVDCSFSEAASEVRRLFIDSVRLHLRSDVPIGTALSGGIDSSAVVMATRSILGPQADIRSFSFIADEEVLREEKWVDLIVGAGNISCVKVHGSAKELSEQFTPLLTSLEEPSTSASVFAQRLVFEAARQSGVTVMMDGQGADETFGGYDHYLAVRIGELLRKGQILEACHLTQSARSQRSLPWAKMILRIVNATLPVSAQRVLQPKLIKFFTPNWLRNPEAGSPLQNLHIFRSRSGKFDLREELYCTLTSSILPHLLRYEDRNSMAYSVESRVPFLVPNLVQFAYSLPQDFLISRNATSKHVFREAMRGIVPDQILDRRDKIGFATPQQSWLRSNSFSLERLIDKDIVSELSLLNGEVIAQSLSRMKTGALVLDNSWWRLVSFIQWAKAFGVNSLA